MEDVLTPINVAVKRAWEIGRRNKQNWNGMLDTCAEIKRMTKAHVERPYGMKPVKNREISVAGTSLGEERPKSAEEP